LTAAPRRLTEDEWFYVGEDRITIRKYPAAEEPDYLVFESRTEPGGGPPTLHTHASSEFFFTLEGELTYFLQEGDGPLRAISGPGGTTAFVPPGVRHTYRNLSSDSGRCIAVVSPGTDLAAFFNEVAVELSGEPLSAQEVTAIYGAYGVVTEVDPALATGAGE
jgi:quercetin dioxygenase-like cupin family protein